MHHNGCLIISTKQSINGFLVLHAAVSVIHHYLSLHACWLHILTEMVHDIFTYIIDTLVSRKECLYTCPSYQFLLVFLAYLVSQRIKLFLKLCLVKVHLNWNGLEVQFQRGPVID